MATRGESGLEKIPAWAWVALAFGLRAAFVLYLRGRVIQIDEGSIEAAAWQLVSGVPDPRAGTSDVLRPLLSHVVSAVYFAFGRHPTVPRLFQAALSAATAWVIGGMTARLTGSRRAGALALAGSAVYPFFIYYSGVLMSETLYLGLLVPGLWVLCESLGDDGSDPRPAAIAGLLLGLAGLARPEGAYIVFVILALSAVACVFGCWRFKALALCAVFWAAPLALWCGGNAWLTGRFVLDTHGGVTLLHGTLLFDVDQEKGTGAAMEALAARPEYKKLAALPSDEKDAAYRRMALNYMLADPPRMLNQWARKTVNFWRLYPRVDKPYGDQAGDRPDAGMKRWALVAASLLFEPWLIALGLWGLADLVWRRPGFFPLPFFALGTWGIHMISVSQMRYRLPVMPLLILGAASVIAGCFKEKARI